MKPQEMQFRFYESALGHVGIQLVFPKQLQHNLQVLVVILLILAVHNNIIKIHKHKLANHISQYIVHDVVKGARGIGQAKAQHFAFVQSRGRSEGCLWNILWLESDLVVS